MAPNPVIPPKIEVLSYSPNIDYNLVYIDLETTSLAFDAEITQIAAVSGNKEFEVFICPTKPISTKANALTKLQVNQNKLYLKGELVESCSLLDGLKRFVQWLETELDLKRNQKLVMVGHNVKRFDQRYLLRDLLSCNLMKRYSNVVSGLIDTLPLFKHIFPKRKCFKQENMVNNILRKEYKAHDAREDVKLLRRLFESQTQSLRLCPQFSYTIDWAKKMFNYNSMKRENAQSLKKLVQRQILTKGMAVKVAGSGLDYSDLERAYQRSPNNGIANLLSKKIHGKPRVTNSKKVLKKISKHFRSRKWRNDRQRTHRVGRKRIPVDNDSVVKVVGYETRETVRANKM